MGTGTGAGTETGAVAETGTITGLETGKGTRMDKEVGEEDSSGIRRIGKEAESKTRHLSFRTRHFLCR